MCQYGCPAFQADNHAVFYTHLQVSSKQKGEYCIFAKYEPSFE